MRFMVIVKADKNSESGVMPSTEMLTAMGKFNEKVVKAGVMLAGQGPHPASKGGRRKYSGKPTGRPGPFAVTNALFSGVRLPPAQALGAALKGAGVVIALDGLQPPSVGARVSFATGKPIVTDGPFTESKEALGGYWMIDVKSREEAIAWAMKCPASSNEIIEIRRVQEMSDFSPEVQQAAAGFAEMQGRAAGPR